MRLSPPQRGCCFALAVHPPLAAAPDDCRHSLAQVWVVNKTGVSLAYRAGIPTKADDHKDTVFVRRPHNATYRTDGDTMLFSR